VYIPVDNSIEAIEKARAATYGISDPRFTRWWADPIVLGERPEGMDFLSDEDLSVIHQPLDFYAYNVYTAADCATPHALSEGRSYEGMPRTTMDWAIEPDCMYWSAKFLYERYKLPILVAENGMANVDFVMRDGLVHDPQRTEFLIRYLRALKKAADEGIPVIGYQYWSLMDNFEWTCGFNKRFGLIHVDYPTGKRTVKDSAHDYAEIIRTNGNDL
jgi:beta-glucosidase